MSENSLLDGSCTSADWVRARPAICVLPVGSFEQHSLHLPLAADIIGAQYFAEFVARELGAALLPTLPYGTSLEQTGLAGTISLTPETLMQVVRNIAAEVEQQGFTTLIILNGHGGNFALAPAVRDINRRNGRLKILLVNHYEFADRSILDCTKQGKTDLHAGEFETSLHLVIAPHLVRPERADMHTKHDWRQSDLNTFGVGYFAPRGAPGYPSLATREKGEHLVASIKQSIIPFIRERLRWLDHNRTYSGTPRSGKEA